MMPTFGESGDWINQPLPIVDAIFDKALADGVADCGQSKIVDYFQNFIACNQALAWIPSLNYTPLHQLKSNSLVKYRCMVQDMFDREFYLGVYEQTNEQGNTKKLRCGKYRDITQCPTSCKASSSSYITHQWTSSSSTKRRLQDDDDNNEVMTATEIKKQRSRDAPQSGAGNVRPNLNFPLPDENGPACIVKVYDDADNIKVNDMIEFIGVLSVDPALNMQADYKASDDFDLVDPDCDMETTEELAAHYPSPSLVPRLHCIVARSLPHSNPLVPISISRNVIDATLKPASIRSQLISFFTNCLGADGLAAEFLLLHLISQVYSRHDVVAVGKYSLNLSNCPVEVPFVRRMYDTIETLVPKSHLLPMSLSNMNSSTFSPRKDYNANRLLSGILQLTAGTHLIVDETAMKPGQLDPNGVKNLTALSNVVKWQKVDYDFNYHINEFYCDLVVLVLSEGKSLLPCDVVVPLRLVRPLDTVTCQQNPVNQVPFSLLQEFRTYLGLVRSLDYNVSDEMQRVLQEDFVDARRLDDKAMTADDFQLMLTTARLITLSFGLESLRPDMWNRVKFLESERKSRITS